MGLFVRMALYFILPSLGTASWIDWHPDAGNLVIDVDGLAVAIPAYAGFIATFFVGRFFKRRGGLT